MGDDIIDMEKMIEEAIEPEEEQSGWEKFFNKYGHRLEKTDYEELIKYGREYPGITETLISATKQMLEYLGCGVDWWFNRVIEIYDEFDIERKAEEHKGLIARVKENRKILGCHNARDRF